MKTRGSIPAKAVIAVPIVAAYLACSAVAQPPHSTGAAAPKVSQDLLLCLATPQCDVIVRFKESRDDDGLEEACISRGCA